MDVQLIPLQLVQIDFLGTFKGMKKYLILLVLLVPGSRMSDHKELKINKVKSIEELSFESISEVLETSGIEQSIDHINWNDYSYAPQVTFKIAHSDEMIYLKFKVIEEHIVAKRTETNSSTHRDSCVEFFIDPDDSGGYYNFEFNCIGTAHIAYGPNRKNRTFIDKDLIESQLFIASSLGREPFEEKSGEHQWELVAAIPASLFVYHQGLNFDGLNAKANLYKCADDSTKPHYLSWSKVNSERPDFHRPEYFGSFHFN